MVDKETERQTGGAEGKEMRSFEDVPMKLLWNSEIKDEDRNTTMHLGGRTPTVLEVKSRAIRSPHTHQR